MQSHPHGGLTNRQQDRLSGELVTKGNYYVLSQPRFRHSRAGGNPVWGSKRLGSRLRGNDAPSGP